MNHRPRIAILACYPVWLLPDSPVPHYKGHYATWLAALSDAFARHQDFDIHWLTFSKAIEKPVCLKHMGQHFHILPRMKQTLGLYTLYFYERRQVRDALKLLRPDIVHAWGNEDCYGLCGSDFPGKKVISTQGMLQAYCASAPFPRFMRHQSLYEPHVYRRYGWVTAESPWSEQCVRKLAPDCCIIPLEYAAQKRFTTIERRLHPTPICLFGGSDTPIKNVDLLIEAFTRPELAHVCLKLAGISPEQRPQLPSNVRALGRVNREEMQALLAEAWCLVHPSLADASPNIVKEARVVGLPVVLTTECGNKHYIEEGKSGFICGVHDADAFIRGILTITKDAETSLRMGAHGLEACRRALSEETMYETLKHIYHTILHS